jgi:hypothetical protein
VKSLPQHRATGEKNQGGIRDLSLKTSHQIKLLTSFVLKAVDYSMADTRLSTPLFANSNLEYSLYVEPEE